MSQGRPTLARGVEHGPRAGAGPDAASTWNHRRLLVVYPPVGNRFYEELAIRLHEAALLLGLDATLISASDLVHCEPSAIRNTTALVVNPDECAMSGRAGLARLNMAEVRGAVTADCVATQWYRNQFELGIEFDAVIDVGFIDQRQIHPFRNIPYHFLFNAPLPRERELIATQKAPANRLLSWSLIATCTIERVRLANDLLLAFGPQGFLFLPSQFRPVRPGEGMLSPDDLRRVLRETTLYVWRSHHDFPYYESFRFFDSLLCGAVPCKIDSRTSTFPVDIPHVYPSVEALESDVLKRSGEELFEDHRAYALDHGTLPDNLKVLLRSV